MKNKQIIRQIVDGVEKLLVVEVIEELNVVSIENQILDISKEIEQLDLEILDLQVKRNGLKAEIEDLEGALQGRLDLQIVESIVSIAEEDNDLSSESTSTPAKVELIEKQGQEVKQEVEKESVEEHQEEVISRNRPIHRGPASRGRFGSR